MPREYVEYTIIFSLDLVIEPPENIGINKHTIKLVKGQQLLYRPIDSLILIELEMLKVYIKTHLKMRFIRLSK